jgi:hypothetical protein
MHSLAFEVPVDQTHPGARTALSAIGHKHPAIEQVTVVKNSTVKFVLVELNRAIDEEELRDISKSVKHCVPSAQPHTLEAAVVAEELFTNRRTDPEIKALMFFHRPTFV